MKNIIATIMCLFAFVLTASAQHPSNNNPDSIIGSYSSDRGGSQSKVRVTKNADGTYDAQIYWGGAKIYDPTKGLRVNATAEFETADKLKLRGTILGVGVTIYWTRIKE